MPDHQTLASLAVVFLLAGTVKGVIGLGLPTVCLALITLLGDLTQAMMLLLVPSFVTNLWQASIGGQGRVLLVRLWPMLLLATATVWLGAMGLQRFELEALSTLLGLSLCIYAMVGLVGWRFSVSPARERWLGPLIGVVNGTLTGLTGSFVVPGVMYLQALGLTRDALVQAMGILFTLSTVALALGLQNQALLSESSLLLSSAGLVPALVGMVLGQSIRKRLSEAVFRKAFFGAILLLGLNIVVRHVV